MAEISVTVGLLSGDVVTVSGLQFDDSLARVVRLVAHDIGWAEEDVLLCFGLVSFTHEDLSRGLSTVGICDGSMLTCLKVLRLRIEVMEGRWVNSKGAKISVSGTTANISGLVTFPVHLNEDNGTVRGVGDHLEVEKMMGPHCVKFKTDTWWRVLDAAEEDFSVFLRTVSGGSKRLEGLVSGCRLSSFREQVAESLQEEFPEEASLWDALTMYLGHEVLTPELDERTLRELGIVDGTSILCVP